MHTLPLALLLAAGVWPGPPAAAPFAELRVVDAATGRGVPLVELETVHAVRFVTDNAGRAAFAEPDAPGRPDESGREVFLAVRGHGYGMPADGFGYAGVRVTPRVGGAVVIEVQRRQIAERLCRLTGAGRWRDSRLLGHAVPAAASNDGRVAGQDSVQAAVYRGRVRWFWGDTRRMGYPLGLFRTAGATTPPPDALGDPADGLPFEYFTDADGFARAMMPLPGRPEGVIWLDGVAVVPDAAGEPKLIAHYSRREGLERQLEHGVAVYDDAADRFVPSVRSADGETWRHPSTHPILFEEDGRRWLLSGSPTPNVRVSASLADVRNPDRYEAFTCADPADPDSPLLDAVGAPVWRWQSALPPTDSATEHRWIEAGTLKPEHARFCPADANSPSDRVTLHSGTVRWNDRRGKWVLVAGQVGGTSHLGEVWYAEADAPTGPFPAAVKVATHDRQSFYNVCHHTFLDRDGGRFIHFEGTYTNSFSGNPRRTPRYEYNQVLYRLDLDAVELSVARSSGS